MAGRVFTALGNVRAPVDQHRILEKIIGSAVLLEDHHHVLNLSRQRSIRRTAAGTATGEAYERDYRGDRHDCEQQDAKLDHVGWNLAGGGLSCSGMITRAARHYTRIVVVQTAPVPG